MIVVVDSGGANLISVLSALARLGVESCVSDSSKEIQAASHVILPGVGSADKVMKRLHMLGLVDMLRALTQPVLGICVGMQVLFESSEEGNMPCLGVMRGVIRKLPACSLPLPHMGWNTLKVIQPSTLMANVLPESYVYFVHSYIAPLSKYTFAMTHYGLSFSAMVQHNNFFGVQFHPERSGKVGHTILKNFLGL
jgi:glutamine amidotransferase